MIDIEIIKAEYASLQDDALLALHDDSHGLTAAAKDALVNVLKERGLINQVETGTTAAMVQSEINAGLNQEMIKWKLEGQDDEMIIARLTHKGIAENEVGFMMQELTVSLKEIINEADANRLSALIRLCCGVAVFVIAVLAQLSKGVYFIGLMLVAVSIVQAAIADSKKSRFVNLLERNETHQQEDEA